MTNQVQSKAIVATQTDAKHIPNSPELLSLGKQAIALINEGDMKKGKGISIMTYVISQAFYSKSFEVNTSSTGLQSFTLEDVAGGIGVKVDAKGNELAKANNKLASARLDILANELFGIDAKEVQNNSGKKTKEYFNVSQKNAFNKAITLISNLIALHCRIPDIIQLDKDNTLQMPMYIAMGEPTNVVLKQAYEKAKHDMAPVQSYEAMLKNVDKLLTARNLKNKRGAASARTPEQKLMDNLGDMTSKAKSYTLEIETGKIMKVDVALRRKMQETFMALTKLFEAERLAEKKAEEAEQKELKAKAKVA